MTTDVCKPSNTSKPGFRFAVLPMANEFNIRATDPLNDADVKMEDGSTGYGSFFCNGKTKANGSAKKAEAWDDGWATSVLEKARAEMNQIEQEYKKKRQLQIKPIAQAKSRLQGRKHETVKSPACEEAVSLNPVVAPLPKGKTISEQKAELLKLVRDAQQQGSVRITQGSDQSTRKFIQNQSEMKGLLAMVHDAQKTGHIQLVRRRSTEVVALHEGVSMRFTK